MQNDEYSYDEFIIDNSWLIDSDHNDICFKVQINDHNDVLIRIRHKDDDE